MIACRFLTFAICIPVVFFFADHAFARSGTRIVATKGQPARVSPGWPDGAGDLVNASSRTSGWNSFFSDWPNDVDYYAFEIKSTDDVNRLIEKLAAIKSDLRQIRLSYLKEPNALGRVTRVPEGNGISLIFSIGDQTRIDEWFKHVRKPFGQLEFTATPEAVPPTLTIFVQNESIELDKLEIPDGIDVSAGDVPLVFHKYHTTSELQREKAATDGDENRELDLLKEKLDESSLAAMKKIEAFLDSRKGGTKR